MRQSTVQERIKQIRDMQKKTAGAEKKNVQRGGSAQNSKRRENKGNGRGEKDGVIVPLLTAMSACLIGDSGGTSFPPSDQTDTVKIIISPLLLTSIPQYLP